MTCEATHPWGECNYQRSQRQRERRRKYGARRRLPFSAERRLLTILTRKRTR